MIADDRDDAVLSYRRRRELKNAVGLILVWVVDRVAELSREISGGSWRVDLAYAGAVDIVDLSIPSEPRITSSDRRVR